MGQWEDHFRYNTIDQVIRRVPEGQETDILRIRLHETELKYQAHFQTNMELRLKVAALEAQVASLDRQIVAYLASDAPPKAEPDPVHRALKFGAGNHPKIGLVT